jgi:4-carboxymuconolactone decarboxylase
MAPSSADGGRRWPDDVNPQSGFRVALPRREDLDDEARQLYDRMNDPKGGTIVGLRGPGGIRLHSSKAAVLSQPLNRYLRFDSAIGKRTRVRELAILVTARECDSQFEWSAHEPEALHEGVPQSLIDIVKYRKPTDGLAEPDKIIIDLGREIFVQRHVAPQTFARALQEFGAHDLVDLVTLMGNYAATAALLCAFGMEVALDKTPLLPRDK